MKFLCDICRHEFDGNEDDGYQDENSNSQNDGKEVVCPDCLRDRKI